MKLLKEDYPVNRFEESARIASLYDLLAIIIGGDAEKSLAKAGNVVRECVDAYGGEYTALCSADWRDFVVSAGLTKTAAIKVAAAIELGKRLDASHDKRTRENFGRPENVARFFMERLRHETQEHFCVAYTNVKNKLIGWKEISVGGLNAAPADVKEAMRWAIRYKAYGLILVHNHPSGYPEPSREDITLTKTFTEASKFVDCEVLDHVIIGDGIYTSLHDRGDI